MMLFKRSFGLTRSLFVLYVHEKGRLGLGMLGVTMATIKLWPQWLAFWTSLMGTFFHVNLRGGGGGQNFSFPTLFDSCRELLFNGSAISWVSIVSIVIIGLGLCTAQLSLPKGTGSKFVFRLCSRSFRWTIYDREVSYFFAFIFHWSRVRSDNDNWRNVSIYFTQWVRLLRRKIRELYWLWLILWWFISCICILSWFVPFPFWIAVRIVIKVLKLEVSYVWGSHDNT